MKTPTTNVFGNLLAQALANWKEPDPQARARVAEMLRKFHAGIPVNDEVARHLARMEPLWASGNPAFVGLTQGTPPPPKPRSEAELLAEAKASEPIEVTPVLLKKLGYAAKQEGAP